MKTTYQKPTTEMIFLNVQQMVCVSGEEKETLSTTETVDDISSLQSRRQSIWGDDDED